MAAKPGNQLRYVAFDKFEGLDLAASPGQVNGAIDMLNVDLDRPGVIRSRNDWEWKISVDPNTISAFWAGFVGVSGTSSFSRLLIYRTYVEPPSDSHYIFARDVTRSGPDVSVIAPTPGSGSPPPLTPVQFGTVSGGIVLFPSLHTLVVISRSGSSPYLTISSISLPGAGAARTLAVQPGDNRVVAISVGDSTSNARVRFSAPADHTTWNSDDYVDLDPGDGEQFMGSVQYKGMLWIFKETKAYCFYGNSVDSFGGSVFNYRTVSLGVRVRQSKLGPSVVAADDGIYASTDQGICIVDGNGSRRMDWPIPLTGEWGGIGVKLTDDIPGLIYGQSRLYALYGRRILVFDERLRSWMAWSGPVTSPQGTGGYNNWIGTYPYDSLRPAVALRQSIYSLSEGVGFGLDDGQNYRLGYYRSGFHDFGSDYLDRVEQTRVWGSGDVTFAMSADYSEVGPGVEMRLTEPGAPPYDRLHLPGDGLARTSVSGRRFSWRVSGEGRWAVHRIVHAVSSQKAAGSS